MFPKPLGGWSGCEEDDFEEAVRNWWKVDDNRHARKAMQPGDIRQLAQTLWEIRQQEKREIISKYPTILDQLLGKDVHLADSRSPDW